MKQRASKERCWGVDHQRLGCQAMHLCVSSYAPLCVKLCTFALQAGSGTQLKHQDVRGQWRCLVKQHKPDGARGGALLV